jgi:outer membrane protein TolC
MAYRIPTLNLPVNVHYLQSLANMKKTIVLSLVLLSQFAWLKAEIYVLDLEKSIQLAQTKSYEMLRLQQDLKISEFNLKSATSALKTHVDLDLVAPQYTETISRDEDSTGIIFFSKNQMNYQGNLQINQPLPTDGRIYIETGVNDYDDYNTDKRSMLLNARLGLTQPLDALYGGYNTIRSTLKQAKLAYERSQKQLKREELNLIYDVSNAFYRLLSVKKGEELAKMNLERQQEAFDIAKNKYEAGLIREVDALQMEVDLAQAQNNYDMSLIDQSSAMNAFKETIGIEFTDSVALSSELTYEVVMVDPERAVSLALENRLEIREQEIQIELNKLNIKRQKSEGMVQGSLSAYYEKSGISTDGLSSSYSSSLSSSFTDLKNRPQNYGIGLNVSIPIIDFGENRARVNAAKAQLKQNEYYQIEVRRSIEREVRNAVDELNSSLKRLQLLEKNVTVAEKSFEITRQRFSDGDIDSQALALERERLNNAYTSHLNAYINYQLMLADMMRKTFYDFQRDEPVK